MARFEDLYNSKIKQLMQEKFGYNNPMQIPKIEKIVLNMGVCEAAREQKKINSALTDLTAISGQKPVATIAKNSIAGFKIRDGMKIGAKVTLRNKRMYEFLDRLITIALPRVRDFRGVSPKSFDGRGNYSMGLKEQIVFIEIDYDKIDDIRGMDVNIVTTAQNDDEARALLGFFGMPFTKYNRKTMAKKSSIEKNLNRAKKVEKNAQKRQALKAVIMNRETAPEERFKACVKLAKLPRNGAKIRLRNRCELTGRPRGYYRKLGLSRIALRELASQGMIPGMIKSSW